jgi:murein DD-endopeptidase MepM/ murein hydrolase activator NlpD
MRLLAMLLTMPLLAAAPARADGVRLNWPLRPPPAVLRYFDAPSPNWTAGHRGVDLAGRTGQRVYAAGAATVVFAGQLAGRPVVSLAHPGGLRTSYEPVQAAVRAGQRVDSATVIGELMAGHPGCPAAACLHWGAMWGAAARADYVNPLGLLAATPIRLKPLSSWPSVRPDTRVCGGAFECAVRAGGGHGFRRSRTLKAVRAQSTDFRPADGPDRALPVTARR